MIYPNLPERALSIRQPWAWAIVNAGKRIENRPRRTHHRGPICIHASLYEPKRPDYDACLNILDQIHGTVSQSAMVRKQGRKASMHNSTEGKARGGIIATAEIVDCVETSDSPWFSGPYGWVLENVQPVPFIPVKGALGLFRWRANLTTTRGDA